jgi:glucose-6-phosphate isomerase
VDGENVVPRVQSVLERMADFAKRVRFGIWKGHSNERIRNIVNIGIGGSDLGPVMAYEALKHYSDRDMTFRFVSNIDATDFAEATHDLDPAETLFIVSQGTIWQIDSFDQWGVELGKKLALRIIPELKSEAEPRLNHDSSTNTLIRRFRQAREKSS